MTTAVAAHDEAPIRAILDTVPDPEIPVLSITDLGVVRFIRNEPDGVTIGIAPTYTGCPATEVIAANVVAALHRHGIAGARVESVLSPPWTSAWISEAGRRKLRDYGIVPPQHGSSKKALLTGHHDIACPRCNSLDTTRVSEFGSTPCKAAYKCDSCLEPFEYFKCI